MKHKLATVILLLAAVSFIAGAARADDEPKSLYERLGGLRGITVVVDDFVDRLFSNPHLGRNAALAASCRQTPPPYLKFQLTQLVCEMSGGPCVYSGQTMKEAHEPLKIGTAEWDAMTAELKESLARLQVPAAEQEELLQLLDETREDIVASRDVGKEE